MIIINNHIEKRIIKIIIRIITGIILFSFIIIVFFLVVPFWMKVVILLSLNLIKILILIMSISMVILFTNHHVYSFIHSNSLSIECIYIPYSTVIESSPVVDGHDVNLAFDYSTDYFYFNSPRNVYLTFKNQFFE